MARANEALRPLWILQKPKSFTGETYKTVKINGGSVVFEVKKNG